METKREARIYLRNIFYGSYNYLKIIVKSKDYRNINWKYSFILGNLTNIILRLKIL